MAAVLTFIAYEAVWFAAVIGAGHGSVWPGVAAAIVFAVWRLRVTAHRRVEARLLLAAFLIGTVLETCWVRAGLIHYAAAWPLASSPAWLLALWATFGLTIVPLFGYLRSRPWLSAGLGAVGGPLSYSAAARGWHAVYFPARPWPSMLGLALGWALALPVLTMLARRWLAIEAGGSAP